MPSTNQTTLSNYNDTKTTSTTLNNFYYPKDPYINYVEHIHNKGGTLANPSYLHTLFPQLFLLNKPTPCEPCILAKSHRQNFKPNNTRVKVPFSLIHSDVWGPAPVIGGQSFRYYVIFVDDCTRMTWIYFLQNKDEVYGRFTAFYAMIQTQFQKSIQIVTSDNGGEYMNSQMNLFF